MNATYRTYLSKGEQRGMGYLLVLPLNAFTGMTGHHVGNKPGNSLEFRDFRDYHPGDDLHRIDWNAYARSGKPVVKLFCEEVTPHVDLVIDCSRSMALEYTAKCEASLGLGAILASAAHNANCTCVAWKASEGFQPVGNASLSPSLWDEIDFTYGGSPAESFEILRPLWPQRGIRLLISDLLFRDDPYQFLYTFSAGAAKIIVIQLIADADMNPSVSGNTRLVDVEMGNHIDMCIDPVSLTQYRDSFFLHQQNWDQACKHTGATLITLIAERIVDTWDLKELEEKGIMESL
ncbi:MAG: DUF58 domain-containing protein [bacterium]